MIFLATCTAVPPLPSWPCRLIGLLFPLAAFSKSALQFLPGILSLAVVLLVSHYLSGVPLLVAFSLLPHYLPRVPLSVVVLSKLATHFLLEVSFLVATFSTIHFLPAIELF